MAGVGHGRAVPDAALIRRIAFLVVCDMLLTGLDAPIEQVMYIDTRLREHNPLHAIARVNRVAPGKQRGFVVDHIGLANHLTDALKINADEDGEDLSAGCRRRRGPGSASADRHRIGQAGREAPCRIAAAMRMCAQDIEFTLVRSDRKTADIVIERSGDAIVRAPLGINDDQTRDAVANRTLWVHRSLVEWEDLNASRHHRPIVQDQGFPYLGRSYRLKFVDEADVPLRLKNGRWELSESGRQGPASVPPEQGMAASTRGVAGSLEERRMVDRSCRQSHPIEILLRVEYPPLAACGQHRFFQPCRPSAAAPGGGPLPPTGARDEARHQRRADTANRRECVRRRVAGLRAMVQHPLMPAGRDDADARTDLGLTAAARNGERAALETLLRRHYDRIHALAWQFMGTRADADDVAQDVCCTLVERLAGFRGEAKFTTWLTSIVFNACRDARRRRRSFQGLTERFGVWSELLRGPDGRDLHDAMWMHGAIARLKPAYRDTIVLVAREGLSHAEAAAILGVAEATVAWRLHEARRLLSGD